MKLPTSVNLGVQSLQGVDENAPRRLGQAQAQTADAFSNALQSFGDVGEDIYKRNASAERNAQQAKYKMANAELLADITANPYEEMPDGSLRSRHTDIINEYDEAAGQLRDNIVGETDNAMAKNQLGLDFETMGAASHTAIAATAVKWANDDAYKKNELAYAANLQNYQYEDAERITAEMIASGQLSKDQAVKKIQEIDKHRTYSTIAVDIEGTEFVNAEDSKVRIEDIRSKNNLSELEQNNLIDKHYVHQEEMFNTYLRTSIEEPVPGKSGGAVSSFGNRAYADGVGADKGGLAYGRFQIREMTFMSAEELGLPDEKSKRRLISSLNSTLNEYQLRADDNKKEMQQSRACNAAIQGTRQMSRTNIASATDIVLNRGEGKDVGAMNCAHDYYTTGLEPGSSEWHQAGPEREITAQGFMSKTSESWFMAQFANAGTPEGAANFGAAVLEMERLKSLPNGERAFSFLSAEEKVLAEEVANLSRAGMPSAEAVTALTAGMSKNDEAAQQANLNAYKETSYPDLKEKLTSSLESSLISLSPLEATIIPDAMVADYNTLLEPLIKRFGDRPSVYAAARESLLSKWSGSDRGASYDWTPNDKQFRKNAPETMYADQAPPERLVPALKQSYEEIFEAHGLNKNDYDVGEAVLVGGKQSYFIRDRTNHVPAVGKDGHPLIWSFDYKDSTYNKLQELESATARNEAEVAQRTRQIEANVNPDTVVRQVGRQLVKDISTAPGRLATEVAYPGLQTMYNSFEGTYKGIKSGVKAGAEFAGDVNEQARVLTRRGQVSGMGDPASVLDEAGRLELMDLYKYDRMSQQAIEKEKARIIKEGKTL